MKTKSYKKHTHTDMHNGKRKNNNNNYYYTTTTTKLLQKQKNKLRESKHLSQQKKPVALRSVNRSKRWRRHVVLPGNTVRATVLFSFEYHPTARNRSERQNDLRGTVCVKKSTKILANLLHLSI